MKYAANNKILPIYFWKIHSYVVSSLEGSELLWMKSVTYYGIKIYEYKQLIGNISSS